MADLFLLRVDLEAMARNLSAADGSSWDVAGVRTWLTEKHGLVEKEPGRFICEEVQMGLFVASEILEKRPA